MAGFGESRLLQPRCRELAKLTLNGPSLRASIASGWSGFRAGLSPTGKRRLPTAHTLNGLKPSATSELPFDLQLLGDIPRC